MNNRRIEHARGKVLGGSSSINGMIFQRGNPMDYERWAGEEGMENWDYAHVLPYFKRMETCLAGADAWRGGSGPLKLTRGPADKQIFGAFFEAVQQAGYPLTDDVNGYRQEGFAKFDRNVVNGRRLSASRAYLHPVSDRKNLRIETMAHVTGLKIQNNRVVGVDYVRFGKKKESVFAGEVILSGGAFNSPQILQLSGIGDPKLMESLGIKSVMDLPGVGQNMQDHLEVYVQHEAKQPVSIGPWYNMALAPIIGAQWLFARKGVGSSNHFEAGGFIRSNDDVDWPNLMFHFLPIAVRYDAETALHPSCTNKMGTDDMSVVDPNSMKVHGMEGLRVVDASVFPFVTNGNIYAPTMMVAERAADLIAGNKMLDPLTEVPYYRAKQGMPLYPEGDPRNNAWNARTDIPSAAKANQA